MNFAQMLQQSLQGQRQTLKKTVMQVRHRDGTVRQETFNDDGSIRLLSRHHEKLPEFFSQSQQGFSELVPQRFDEEKNAWFACLEGPTVQQRRQSSEDELVLVSYNVWFSERRQEFRAHKLIELVQTQAPDIICFQVPVVLQNQLACH